jgi:ferritin
MFTQKLQDAINEQINAELYSAYLYLAMAADLEDKNLPGFAHWMRLQHDEEQIHAMKLFDFMLDRGGRVVLNAIDAPQGAWDSALAIFENAYAHEQKVTALIHALYKLAVEESDYPTQSLLQWFIDEQVEEEKNASDAVAQLQMTGDFGPGLLMMDREMALRMPAPEAEAVV